MAEHSPAVTKRLYEALDRCDLEALVGLCDPAVEVVAPPSLPWACGTRTGLVGAVDCFTRAFGMLERTRFSVTEMRPTGDDRMTVVGNWWGRVRDTGREFDVRFVHLWTFRHGMVVKAEVIIDSAGILRAFEPGAGP
ncbi:nuclear transport factor 2 family protein [Streptomyces uncialis]|uniref:nuclear transport factor 2 family protein n=1 Tax=Streptomyces uncialis TaxID=1048205 RepID=UPI0038651D29|nr:nuclear transport factor 2 family protein [Streptomyces uncialis]